MGAVYKGVDGVNHRQVAIKILPPQQASDPERVKRFLREARVVARLDLGSWSSSATVRQW